jgi:hypothetical protein
VKTIRAIVWVWLAGLLAGAGCATHVRFAVDPSPLDFIQVLYVAKTANGSAAQPIRIDLEGSGYLRMLSGQSTRVMDPYWKNQSAEDWSDLRTEQVVLSREETARMLQRLVNAGFFDRQFRPEAAPPKGLPRATIAAKVAKERNIQVTVDPKLLDLVQDILSRVQPSAQQ